MRFTVRILLFISSSLMFACDGPNQDATTSTAQRGVHNPDAFQVALKVNGGASVTSEANVSVQISAIDAKEMYVTQESACNIGGEWEPLKSFKLVTMQKSNAVNFFYVKVRNNQSESDCAFTSIYHDSLAPSLILTSPTDGSNLVNPNELTLTGTCNEEAKVYISVNSLVSFSTLCTAGVWSKSIDTTALTNGNFAVSIKAIDLANNSSAVQLFSFIK